MKKITITLILVLSIGFGQGVTLDPTSIEFGPVTLNSTKYDTVQVTNDLGTAQTITFSGQSAPFSLHRKRIHSLQMKVQTLYWHSHPRPQGLSARR